MEIASTITFESGKKLDESLGVLKNDTLEEGTREVEKTITPKSNLALKVVPKPSYILNLCALKGLIIEQNKIMKGKFWRHFPRCKSTYLL